MPMWYWWYRLDIDAKVRRTYAIVASEHACQIDSDLVAVPTTGKYDQENQRQPEF